MEPWRTEELRDHPALPGKSILLTGGTGSFGKAFTRRIVAEHPEIERLVIFSRDELKQYEMQLLPEFKNRRLRFFIGDVRDRRRLTRALDGIDIVVHAAALKQVPVAEYNPFEFVKTNVLGAQNLVEACMDQNVHHVVALSTDKAAAPINLYGATKLCSDKLFVAANNHKGTRDLRFSVVRYGNVMGSRGSVVPFFLKQRHEGVVPITHPEMTRFNITLEEGVDLVMFAIRKAAGGEIFVPRIPSYRLPDLAAAIAPGCEQIVVGVRPGEKLHEEMITHSDSFYTVEYDDHYAILPTLPHWDDARFHESDGRPCTPGFSYDSGTNPDFLDVPTLRELIKEHVDPDFEG